MKRKFIAIPIAGAFLTGLIGCSQDEATKGENVKKSQPFGYYSNENHQSGGNVKIFNENDGPITELMDHTFGMEGQREKNQHRNLSQQKNETGN